jgi:hypothetical protein
MRSSGRLSIESCTACGTEIEIRSPPAKNRPRGKRRMNERSSEMDASPATV